jgi:CheY-like chemotaxis protein
LARDLWEIEADADQLTKVIHNLVLNASEAMPEGGTIIVGADNVTISPSDSSTLAPGRYVRIRVTDQGIGIPPEHREKIFDPYFSTKERGNQKGLGMGLAVCHSIVTKHRGHLSVESHPKGTTFEILLPAVTEDGETIAVASAASPAPESGTGRILLMDDDKTIQKLGGKMLRHLGYQVDLADDGRQAVDLYDAAGKAGAPYDAVIMDLTIPGGMGGVETLKELQTLDASVRAIVSSGYADDPVMADHARYGFMGGVVKPYNLATLRKTLQEVVS